MNTTTQSPSLVAVPGQSPEALKTKPHFDVLDGLRGIAALAIVVFHFMEWVFPDPRQNFIGHGFLAVDFFFCLSGFVIGYAYDDRLKKIGVRAFFTSRIIRLHPLVVLGSVLGLLGFLLDPFAGQSGLYSVGKLLLIFGCSLLLIPFPVMQDRAFNLFGFNAPAWSLFWEYVANIVYALVLSKLPRRILVVVTVVAAAALSGVAFRAGNLLGGWNGETFWHGGARVAYSFSAGLLLYRYGWIIRNRLGFTGLAVLLSLAFVMPFASWNWLAELLVVLFYFPLLVALGAGTVLAPRTRKLCVASGNISYPLYMTHYWALWVFGNYYTAHKPAGGELALIIAGGTVLLVGFAWLMMTVYDTPLRRYWSRRRQIAMR